MEHALSIEDIRRAWEARDSDLADQIVALASLPDTRGGERGPGAAPPREGAPTLESFVASLRSPSFRKKSRQDQGHLRREGMKALEAPSAEVPLPDRALLHEVLLALWADNGAFARDALLQVIARAPLKWGIWRAFKRIFKEAEERSDFEIFGALTARFDAAFARGAASEFEISRRTIAYLARRAWRRLRREAEALPAAYPDAAASVLRFYAQDTRWTQTWVYNHIVFHETKKYTRRRFSLDRRTQNLLQHRAYGELWRRSPRPLFTLLERAASDEARSFAVAALKADFRATLRDVEPTWVARLIAVRSAAIDEFVVFLLANVPRFEQSAFRELGLHAAVIALLDSPASEARSYAAAYARTHARDLELSALYRLINSSHEEVSKLARDLLLDRDPRKDIGLEGWGNLLGTPRGHEIAAAALRKHFGAKELTAAWFKERLVSQNRAVLSFAVELCLRIHTPKALGADFFRDLLDDPRLTEGAARFAMDGLSRFSEEEIGDEPLKRALLHPLTSAAVSAFIAEGRVKPGTLGASFWKALAFQPTWDSDPWVLSLKQSGRVWARDLAWSERLSTLALSLLSDVRRFSPADLGFDWLLGLAARSEKAYADFAVEYMIKAFVPADFAPKKAEEAPVAAAAPAAPIDLKAKSFLFTGKLATMQRGDATKKVTAANGKNVSSISAKLDYLVIGDDGSPLYGAGRKGSKQLAAEKLIAEGAPIKVISETAFLQMLSRTTRAFSEDTSVAGAERLFALVTEPGPADAPLRRFAIRYIERHHPDVSPALTDRPVDPGAELPSGFLTFERLYPLFFDPREPLRAFALLLARYELSRMRPPLEAIVALSEAPYPEVRAFIATALLAGDDKEQTRYRIDPETLTADAVYRFCESLTGETRALGMKLIQEHPRLAVPEELFRLTESPDRQVRAFVIKTIWSLYRDKGVTFGWKPAPKREATAGKKAEPAKTPDVVPPAPPVTRPSGRPAPDTALRDFFRRILFTVPPGRLPKSSEEPAKPEARTRPLPARKAKLALIEVIRDLAVEDAAFAAVVTPLLEEFLSSRGASERAACLVALTRIHKAHKDAA